MFVRYYVQVMSNEPRMHQGKLPSPESSSHLQLYVTQPVHGSLGGGVCLGPHSEGVAQARLDQRSPWKLRPYIKRPMGGLGL